jgi:hypothetical protein
MRKLVIAAISLVLVLSVAAGVVEAERSRSIDPPAPIARSHGAAIARPILASARARGWRLERRGRVALTTEHGERELVRRLPFEDRTYECVAAVAAVSGQFAITDLGFDREGGPHFGPDGGGRERLAMSGAVCHFWPFRQDDLRRAMTSAWSLSFSPYEEHPGPNVLRVEAIALGNGSAPRTGTLEVTFLRMPWSGRHEELVQAPELDRSLVREGPRTASIERGVAVGANVLVLGALLASLVLGVAVLVRRLRAKRREES